MFDWFIEMGLEMSGVDTVAAKKERMEKREQKKLNRYIFSYGMKVLIIAMGILYVAMAGSVIIMLRTLFLNATAQIVKYVLMSVDAIVVIFALLVGKKKGEIVALVGVFIFVVGLFLTTVLM